jgi:uncharacterized protein YukE
MILLTAVSSYATTWSTSASFATAAKEIDTLISQRSSKLNQKLSQIDDSISGKIKQEYQKQQQTLEQISKVDKLILLELKKISFLNSQHSKGEL